MNPLEQSTTGINETRRAMLLNLLKERYKNDDVPDYYIDQEVDYYLNLLNDNKPILQPRPQAELTDADSINQEMLETEIDIHTVYDQLNQVGQQMNQHQTLNESVLNDVSLRAKKVEEKLEEIGHALRNNSAHAVVFETFIDFNNREKNTDYYTERDGSLVPPANFLTLDSYQNSIKLPTTYTENTLVNFAGVRLAKIEITKQIGGGFIRSRNPEHTIDKAIDTSMSTYWNESILSDEPFEVNLGTENYGLDFGASCELMITLDYISRVNEITFTPFTEYPMEVVAIHIYTTDDEEEVPFELVSPTAILKNIESTDIISYQFQTVVAKRIKVLLNQQHFVKEDVLVEVEDKTLTDAWLQAQGHVEIDANKIFKPVYLDQNDMHPQWVNMQKYLEKRDIVKEIQRSDDIDPTNKIHLSKYEYQYGLYNLAVNHNDYFYNGVYVTKPISNSNVHIATLETIEEHPILEELQMPITSIEYYMTDVENPKAEDWTPILPTNVKDIISERLFVDTSVLPYRGRARFGVDRIYNVRKNGDPLLAHTDYRISGRTITFVQYDPSAIYTIDYRPLSEAYQVDFLKKYTTTDFDPVLNRSRDIVTPRKEIEDTTLDNDTNEFTLAYYPFLDKDKLNTQDITWNPTYLENTYLPFKVRLTLPDGQYVDQKVDPKDTPEVFITNRTDYYDSNRSLLEPFTGVNYQYRIEGNKIKFNTQLPKGTRIYMEYDYLTGPIRMKVIMRRNLNEVEGLTPFLHEYKIGIQTLV